VHPVPGLAPSRSVQAIWLRGRRQPAIPAMARALSEAATTRLAEARAA
jgi:hypothetical protein